MKSLARFGFALFLGGAMAASCVPDFQFATEPAGAGGHGGSGGGAGSTATSADAGGGGGADALPTVPCGTSGAECAPGQLCCSSQVGLACDHCSFSTRCTTPKCADDVFTFLRCNGGEDCNPDEICCIALARGSDGQIFPIESSCKAACTLNVNEFEACHLDADCIPTGSSLSCLSLPVYPGYKVCG